MTDCRVCAQPLEHEPVLGSYIMHSVCREAVFRFMAEAEKRAGLAERNLIVQWLRNDFVNEKYWAYPNGPATAREYADAIEKGEHQSCSHDCECSHSWYGQPDTDYCKLCKAGDCLCAIHGPDGRVNGICNACSDGQ